MSAIAVLVADAIGDKPTHIGLVEDGVLVALRATCGGRRRANLRDPDGSIRRGEAMGTAILPVLMCHVCGCRLPPAVPRHGVTGLPACDVHTPSAPLTVVAQLDQILTPVVVKRGRGRPRLPPEERATKTPRIKISCTPEEHARWIAAAGPEDVAAWVRGVANAAASS